MAGEQAAHEAETAVLALAVLVRLTAHAGPSRAKVTLLAAYSSFHTAACWDWLGASPSLLQLTQSCSWSANPLQLPLRRVRGSAGRAPCAAGCLLDAAPPTVRGCGRPGSAVRQRLCFVTYESTSSHTDLLRSSQMHNLHMHAREDLQ